MNKTTQVGGMSLTIESVAGGSFTQVKLVNEDGRRTYSRTHQFETDAQREYDALLTALDAGER